MKDVLNQILEEYVGITVVFLLILSIASGLLVQMKKITSKERQLQEEGFIGAAIVAGGVFLVLFILGVLVNAAVGAAGSFRI